MVLGAPMNATHEYIEQLPALAYVVGYLNASGMKIEWEGIPQTINYGNKKPVKAEDDIEEAEYGSKQ